MTQICLKYQPENLHKLYIIPYKHYQNLHYLNNMLFYLNYINHLEHRFSDLLPKYVYDIT